MKIHTRMCTRSIQRLPNISNKHCRDTHKACATTALYPPLLSPLFPLLFSLSSSLPSSLPSHPCTYRPKHVNHSTPNALVRLSLIHLRLVALICVRCRRHQGAHSGATDGHPPDEATRAATAAVVGGDDASCIRCARFQSVPVGWLRGAQCVFLNSHCVFLECVFSEKPVAAAIADP